MAEQEPQQAEEAGGSTLWPGNEDSNPQLAMIGSEESLDAGRAGCGGVTVATSATVALLGFPLMAKTSLKEEKPMRETAQTTHVQAVEFSKLSQGQMTELQKVRCTVV